MKILTISLVLIALLGCNSKEEIHAKYEINWAGSRYACTESYSIKDGFYKFYAPKTGKTYSVPALKVDAIIDGCTYFSFK